MDFSNPHIHGLIVGIMLIAGGAFGGLIAGVKARTEHTLDMPFGWKPLKLGFLGDTLVGVGASIVAMVFYSILPASDPNVDYSFRHLCAYVGFGIASGYTGIKIIEKASGDILSLEHKVDVKVQVTELLSEARYLLATEKYSLAAERFKQALGVDPKNLNAKYGLATARNFADPRDHRQPVHLISEVIEEDPNFSKAHYNRACFMSLNKEHYNVELIKSDLRTAFRLNPSTKEYARNDSDFSAWTNEQWFKELVV